MSWAAINHGLTNTDVQALVIDAKTPTTLYAGTAGGGVFTSSDGGATWEEMNNGLTNLYVTSLVIDPLTGTTLYAGTLGGGVFDLQIVPSHVDLSVSVIDSPDPALINQQLAYQFTITNHGPATATDVTLTDTLPATLSSVSASPGCSGASTVTCVLGALNSGSSTTATIVVQPTTAGVFRNTATVMAAEEDSRPANNTVTELATVNLPSGPDLTGFWQSFASRCKSTSNGEQCTLSGKFALQNQGTQKAPTLFLTGFYLSSDDFYDASDSYLSSVIIGKLKAGRTKAKKWSARLSPGRSPSGQFLIAVVDAVNTVEEMNGGNFRKCGNASQAAYLLG